MDGPEAIDRRGYCLKEAAHYVGVSENTFLEEVRNRRLPAPIRFGRRRVWDKRALDRALDDLGEMKNGNLGRWSDVGKIALRGRKD